MADMAILHEIDKCMRCRGCQVACEKKQGLTTIVGNAETVQADDVMVVKAQGSNFNPPFVRYSCWHCYNPPCATGCPFKAMKTGSNGGVYVDKALCNPAACHQECARDCRKGGYPKIGTNAPGTFAYKCDLCYDRVADATLPVPADGVRKPACVTTCPARALTYDTVDNIKAKLNQNSTTGYSQPGDVWMGEGHVFWARKNVNGALATFTPPTTDPFIEDHISPMFGKILKSPVAAAVAVPAVFLGGLYALIQRRIKLSEAKEV
jgi:anaerobic dimethyl sulfoxide reductase subunit B (iron-sulfur subunit)